VPAGYGAISADGEIMVHTAPGFEGQGIGKVVASKLAGRARPFFARVFANARPLTAGERLARFVGLAETERRPGRPRRGAF
jgi:GNAT superfamily N-acetyltransferase